ncbi:hypothetical protein CENSYa_0428 [Cenarchaeum symbiosum A]|uniref:Uncharacterized protein n=1 Tax=Cenarchaeum symbiosum (strain A) TaxID=414004 RepID=A0RUP6_CENSY|nr:hypothetical protein CENSYa_0428 [Cenarchaeum symbiosum A]
MSRKRIIVLCLLAVLAGAVTTGGAAFAYISVSGEELKADVREWLIDNDPNKMTQNEKMVELKDKHYSYLAGFIEMVRVIIGGEFSEDDVRGMMYYVIHETIKDEKMKLLKATAQENGWGG